MTDQTDLREDFYLVLNAGSSSVKFAVYRIDGLKLLFHGQIDIKGGSGCPRLDVIDAGSKPVHTRNATEQGLSGSLSVMPILEWLDDQGLGKPRAIGHRVVHGGEKFQQPALVSETVLGAIDACTPFAPLHNPANLQGIRDCESRYPSLPQVVVFDTAFHQTMAPQEYLYAVPYEWYQRHGVRRYGFHGTSHQYVSEQAETLLGLEPNNGGFITLHLGNGCSAAAIERGRSVDTSMGLTPLEGLMMGTRSGDIDPGLHEYLCQRLDVSLAEVTHSLNKASGLKGVSQISSDMRELQAAMESGNEQAKLAFDMFCARAAKSTAAMRVSLSRLDAIVFTGGIGEHSAKTRSAIIRRLPWLCHPIDPAANEVHGKHTQGLISCSGVDDRCAVLVVATDEERMIAKHMHATLTRNTEQRS